MSKKLLLFSIIFTFVNSYFVYLSQKVVHGGEVIFVFLLVIWILGIVLLYILYLFDKKIIVGKLNKVIFFFCTPIPVLFFFFASYICATQKIENIYVQNGHIIKETKFIFQKRIEYRSDNDSKTGELLIDSVTYYDKETERLKTDTYEGWERFLLSEGK
ncbi:hypothetical protein ACNQGO_11750 [Flavobacterium sp. ZT3P35]|uniref:hypothetical protein n=1 Tax=Flavobacterium sp. ZT3P35 TaxID=3401727 RepID=UPI003AB0D397